MSGLNHNVSAQANELLDHIYEYGTNSEGVISRINSLCDAAVEQLRTELVAGRDAGAITGYARGLREMRDCRTCRNYTRDGCIQTAQCVDGDGYRRATPVRFWSAALRGEECDLPPRGWRCTRAKGHSGPCAAVECPEEIEIVERAMTRLRGEAKP